MAPHAIYAAVLVNYNAGAELDLLVFVNGQRLGMEFRYADAPSVTRSLAVAHEDLKLRTAFVVHPGRKSYPLNQWAEAVGICPAPNPWKKTGPTASPTTLIAL